MQHASGMDYYGVEELFAEEELLVRDTVRDWVRERAAPLFPACYEEGRFPRELVPELGRLGLLGATLPQEYGCAGVNSVAYGLAMQELERCDSGLRSFASVQGALAMYAIHAYGTDEQRRRWLPPMARGEAIGCFGLTEADGGSDPGAMRTRATRAGDGYLLRGAKMWITNGSIADVAVVWAKLDGVSPGGGGGEAPGRGERAPESGRDVVRGFLVERGTPGFSAPDLKHKLSLRASVTSELVLDDVLVPAGNLLPGALGLKAAFDCLTQARYGIAWGGLGAAQACLAEALDFAGSRRSFGSPLAAKQLVQGKLVWMVAELSKCQLLCWRLGRLKDEGAATSQQVSLAKRECVSLALRSARLARDILGASGITAEYQAMRHLCNLESVFTYEGTHDIHTLIVGESVTGLRAY